jgi:hypothetical protein
VVLVLLTGWFLPFAADALAGRDRVVGAAADRFLDWDALGVFGGPHGPEDSPAGSAELSVAVHGEDALLQRGTRLTIAPRPELTLAETIELHGDHLVRGANGK